VASLPWLTLGHSSGGGENRANVSSGAEIRDQGLLFIHCILSTTTSHQARLPYKKDIAVIEFCKALLQEYLPQQMLLGMQAWEKKRKKISFQLFFFIIWTMNG